jgi:uncharacterized protein YcbK (DUF882 family)
MNERDFGPGSSGWSRRELLRAGLGGAVLGALPGAVWARPAPGEAERRLSFHNLHTGERLRTVYWAEGDYVPDSLAEVDHVLRDFRTGEVKRIAPGLLDLLHRVAARLETSQPFDVISGYRSAATNAMLAARSGGVASHSLHVEGMAIDVRVPGRSVARLRDVALALRGGGVGYYPASAFVHVDVGRVRRW